MLTRGRGGALEAERLGVDPGRIDESLLVVDAGSARGGRVARRTRPGRRAPRRSSPGRIVEALRGGRYEEVVDLARRGAWSRTASGRGSAGSWSSCARRAGPPGRSGAGRLVAVWAPPGSRGPGRREAVKAALQAAGLKPLAVRVDLRGLELD